MSRLVRGLLWFVVLAQATFALGFYFGLPFALALWPFNQTGHMSQVFIGSIFAAAAAATGWCLAAREQAGLTGIGLDYLAIFGPLSVYSLAVGVLGGNLPVGVFGVIALAGVGMGAWLVRLGRAAPFRDQRPTPRPVRLVFGFFVVALVIVGGGLVLGGLLGSGPVIVPWPVTPDLSVVIGVMFLGAAVYFGYALLHPVRGNMHGQLAGFLAYDIVLIGPFLARLPELPAEFALSQAVYLLVVVGSGLLAAAYLWRAPPIAHPVLEQAG